MQSGRIRSRLARCRRKARIEVRRRGRDVHRVAAQVRQSWLRAPAPYSGTGSTASGTGANSKSLDAAR